MKNTTELLGSWKEAKGKLKQKFALLTNNEPMLAQGKQDEIVGKLQVKLGKTKTEINRLMTALKRQLIA